jgi:hypothetical protein
MIFWLVSLAMVFIFEDKWIDGRTLFRVIVGMRVSSIRRLVFVDKR